MLVVPALQQYYSQQVLNLIDIQQVYLNQNDEDNFRRNLYIPIAVEILRYLKENIFATLYLYIILKKRDLCFKGYIYIFIFIQEDL